MAKRSFTPDEIRKLVTVAIENAESHFNDLWEKQIKKQIQIIDAERNRWWVKLFVKPVPATRDDAEARLKQREMYDLSPWAYFQYERNGVLNPLYDLTLLVSDESESESSMVYLSDKEWFHLIDWVEGYDE